MGCVFHIGWLCCVTTKYLKHCDHNLIVGALIVLGITSRSWPMIRGGKSLLRGWMLWMPLLELMMKIQTKNEDLVMVILHVEPFMVILHVEPFRKKSTSLATSVLLVFVDSGTSDECLIFCLIWNYFATRCGCISFWLILVKLLMSSTKL